MSTQNTPTQNPYHQFLRMVHKMRKNQKAFFQTKTRASLQAAQASEREVDKFLEAIGFQAAQVRQLQLGEQPTEGQGST